MTPHHYFKHFIFKSLATGLLVSCKKDNSGKAFPDLELKKDVDSLERKKSWSENYF